MALIGYARVSTHEQHLHLQQDALSAAGCLKIYTDTISGAKSERKGLAEALDFIRDGDTLVVWWLDPAWSLPGYPFNAGQLEDDHRD